MSPSEKISEFILQRPYLMDVASGLQSTFSITWASHRKSHRTDLDVLLLKPNADCAQTFGFEKEIALFYSPYEELQARTPQAIEDICTQTPLLGRIDPSVVFLSAPAKNLSSWVAEYLSYNQQSRSIVSISPVEFRAAIDDPWKVKNCIKDRLFIRNLFDYKLPLKSDAFFYGRDDIVASLMDNVRKSQNSALFGLRKTGKTSVLLKIERLLKREGIAETVFFDCKSRRVRSASCDDLLWQIIKKIDSHTGSNFFRNKDVEDPEEILGKAVQKIKRGSKICVIFDEIEYISPISPLNDHWKLDFIEFWQILWALQTVNDKIVFVICGVNPTVCDIDRFESPEIDSRTVQNPVFGIFNTYFLRGFSHDSLANMIGFFGDRMGLRFGTDAIEYLHTRYGGHPLLTRLACSYHHNVLLDAQIDRPIEVNKALLESVEQEREDELAAYCEHVVSEIRELYELEFELLKALATGNIVDYYEFSRDKKTVKHIMDYGLVGEDENGQPSFIIPVVENYLRNEEAKTHWSSSQYYKVPVDKRSLWLQTRRRSTIEDMCTLNELLQRDDRTGLFAGGAPAKVVELDSLSVCENEEALISCLVLLSKVYVENIEKHMKLNDHSFHIEFKETFGALYESLMRIKAYRNYFCHIELNVGAEKRYQSFLQKDFQNNWPGDIQDGWFLIQQRVLDGLHVALQIELAKQT